MSYNMSRCLCLFFHQQNFNKLDFKFDNKWSLSIPSSGWCCFSLFVFPFCILSVLSFVSFCTHCRLSTRLAVCFLLRAFGSIAKRVSALTFTCIPPSPYFILKGKWANEEGGKGMEGMKKNVLRDWKVCLLQKLKICIKKNRKDVLVLSHFANCTCEKYIV